MKRLTLPLPAFCSDITCGETVYLTGEILTARDAAHRVLYDMMKRGEQLPVDLQSATIYYAGPSPARPGQVIGSCGPTTSKRMNAFAPTFYERGVRCVIGKGPVSDETIQAIVANGATYFCAIGGVGALLAACVKQCSVVALPELLSEAVHKLYVEDMPVIAAITPNGDNIFNR